MSDSPRRDAPPRLGIVGCGAIAGAFHLPALLRHRDVAAGLVFVDRDEARANALREQAGSGRTARDLGEVVGELDGVIVATPHHLHAPLAAQAAASGVHVLCEKPVAANGAELERVLDAAGATRVHVAVNNNRRLYPSFRRVHAMLRDGAIGEIRRATLTLGEKFAWPAASGHYFGRASGGRGVVADTGAHVLDLLCWWLGDNVILDDAQDDSAGGSEADARLTGHAGAAQWTVRLSWLSRLANTFRIEGTRGVIEGEMYDWRTITVTGKDGRPRVERCATGTSTIDEVGFALVDSFLDAVRGGSAPLVTIADVAPSIRLIDAYYAARRPMPQAWQPCAAAWTA